jgi:hypothetical protein
MCEMLLLLFVIRVGASFVILADTPEAPLINRSAATAAALVVGVLSIPGDETTAALLLLLLPMPLPPWDCLVVVLSRQLRLTSSPLPLLKATSSLSLSSS